ncbi:unnamed protein product [Prorocentrum cordatum]|uniref:Uncharacterized protein n=1 Tax=Prorocentrum cordatum TaxID=2364126 RepID=A0ABN9U607_9DINO|nr:unnamed protein product [Polarella glacialis]
MSELRGRLASVAYDIPAHVRQGSRTTIADHEKSKILEGDYPALRTGVVAARMALFGSDADGLPRIDAWQDTVITLAKALQVNEDLASDVCNYQASLVCAGLRDAQVRGRSRAGRCHVLPSAMLALLSVVPLLLAVPGAVVFSPILFLAWRKHRATIQKAAPCRSSLTPTKQQGTRSGRRLGSSLGGIRMSRTCPGTRTSFVGVGTLTRSRAAGRASSLCSTSYFWSVCVCCWASSAWVGWRSSCM